MLIYLGSAYSDPDPSVMAHRYKRVCETVAYIARMQQPCYCPIAFWHEIALAHNLPKDAFFWEKQNLEMMKLCGEAWFINEPAFYDSIGCQFEVEFFFLRVPVYLVDQQKPYDRIRQN